MLQPVLKAMHQLFDRLWLISLGLVGRCELKSIHVPLPHPRLRRSASR
jgi:hypothetical protein